jgi:UMF1 family MFS transporter
LFRFFIARIFFIDALVTLFAFGGIYAAATFEMPEQDILLFGITLNISAGVGAAVFALVDDYLGGKKMILFSLLCLIVLGTGALLAQTERQFWIIATMIGIFVGPIQASSRSYLARVVPKPLMSQMFGFFAFSGKATAFLGPLLVGWMTYLTANDRLGLSVVVVFLIIGLCLMMTVRSDKEERKKEEG